MKKELSPEEFESLMQSGTVVDLREVHEQASGKIKGSVHHPFSQIDIEALSQKEQPLFFYCSKGYRSLSAAEKIPGSFSMRGGLDLWKEEGRAIESDLPPEEAHRYSRQILLPEVSIEGQKRIRQSSILLVGGGGLGSPAALYLAAAGVGRLGIVDDDLVESSNLPRQTLYKPGQSGQSKAETAKDNLHEINPDCQVVSFQTRIDSTNAMDILSDGWDVVLDGADNFPTRYLLNDATRRLGIPLVSASILGFQGQLTSFMPEGPCYRCIWPEPPPREFAPSCSEAGILGTVSGTLGTLQANEALKIVGGFGEVLQGKLLLVDLLQNSWDQLRVQRRDDCPACQGLLEELPDYELFCAV